MCGGDRGSDVELSVDLKNEFVEALANVPEAVSDAQYGLNQSDSTSIKEKARRIRQREEEENKHNFTLSPTERIDEFRASLKNVEDISEDKLKEVLEMIDAYRTSQQVKNSQFDPLILKGISDRATEGNLYFEILMDRDNIDAKDVSVLNLCYRLLQRLQYPCNGNVHLTNIQVLLKQLDSDDIFVASKLNERYTHAEIDNGIHDPNDRHLVLNVPEIQNYLKLMRRQFPSTHELYEMCNILRSSGGFKSKSELKSTMKSLMDYFETTPTDFLPHPPTFESSAGQGGFLVCRTQSQFENMTNDQIGYQMNLRSALYTMITCSDMTQIEAEKIKTSHKSHSKVMGIENNVNETHSIKIYGKSYDITTTVSHKYGDYLWPRSEVVNKEKDVVAKVLTNTNLTGGCCPILPLVCAATGGIEFNSDSYGCKQRVRFGIGIDGRTFVHGKGTKSESVIGLSLALLSSEETNYTRWKGANEASSYLYLAQAN